MKTCFAIYLLGMAALASFEPPAPSGREALRASASVREPATLRAPSVNGAPTAGQRAGSAGQR